MPRRVNARPSAASAAAAAANSATPTFTSFAAATAHALGSHDSAPTPTSTEWDDEALKQVKRLTKRDATTKLRTLKDLSAHLQTLSDDDKTTSGKAFITVWGTTFPSLVLNDSAPAVRAACLTLMLDVVVAFGRQTQPMLPDVLPAWVAATGDVAPAVAATATSSLSDAFSSSEKRRKAALRFAQQLRSFSADLLMELNKPSSSELFLSQALRILAVLQWLLEATDDLTAIAPVIDGTNDMFRLLARGPKSTDKQQRVFLLNHTLAAFAVDVLYRTAHVEHESRAKVDGDGGDDGDMERTVRSNRFKRLANLTVQLANISDPAAWDLFLVFLKEAPDEIAPMRPKLTSSFQTAVTTVNPAALSALLPLVNTMNPPDVAPDFSRKVLLMMRSLLLPNYDYTPTMAYVIAALPAFVEAVAFVHDVALRRWFQGCVGDGTLFVSEWFDEFVLPTCRAVISGVLPALSENSSSSCTESVGMQRRNNGINVFQKVVPSIGRLLRQMSFSEATRASPDLAGSLVTGLAYRNVEQMLRRYDALLEATGNSLHRTLLAKAVVLATTEKRDDVLLLNALNLVARTLMKSSANDVIVSESEGLFDEDILERLLSFKGSVLSLVNTEDESVGDIELVAEYVGVINSWSLWVGCLIDGRDGSELVMNGILDLQSAENRFLFLGETISAHKHRIASGQFNSCHILSGVALDRAILEAIATIEQKNASPICIRFLLVSTESSGGADVSLDIIAQITKAVSGCVRMDSSNASFDSLIISLLTSSIQRIDAGAVDVLISACFRRGAYSEQVLLALSSHLKSLETTDLASYTEKLIEDLQEDAETSLEKVDTVDLGHALAHIVFMLGGRNVQKSVSACKKLLVWSPPKLTQSFLQGVPFEAVFGDGCYDTIVVEDMLDALQRVYSTTMVDALPRLKIFLETIGKDAMSEVAASTIDFILAGCYPVALDIVRLICASSIREGSDCVSSFSVIAQKIANCTPKTSESESAQFLNVAQLVYTCVRESNGRFVNYLENVLTDVTKVIRRDPSAPVAFVALDIMSSSLAHHVEESQRGAETTSDEDTPSWFRDNLSVTLRAIRRCLEQPRGMKKANIEALETHCACFVYHCMSSFGKQGFLSDDVRFWTLRTRNAVEKFVKRASSEKDFITSTVCKRMAWICKLACKLVEFGDEEETTGKSALVDEMCHWGAWSSVHLIPAFVEEHTTGASVGHIIERVDAESCGWLIVEACERGVLLGKDGGFPVVRESIYKLLPRLGCPSGDMRKAILALCAYAAAVDLPEIVNREFPETGFADESDEEAFATRMIPKELRNGLRWPEGLDESRIDHGGDTTGLEVGYFLTWRLFLDLVRGTDETTGHQGVVGGNGGEEVSFRRVGVTFLRENSEVFAEFFKRCVDVVVDGSMVERNAASLAAEEALQSEEREAQGLELALQPTEDEGKVHLRTDVDKSEFSDSDEIQIEVGRAAGIAFSRALQRLPALSREHIDRGVDRGTQGRVENFVRKRISPLLIGAEIRKVREWGMFGGRGGDGGRKDEGASSSAAVESEGELQTYGSVAGRELRATYTFSDVTLEIGMLLPDVFPLRTASVEARTRVGMSEARWRKTLLGMTTLLHAKNGTLAEAVELWRRNLDKTFQGAEECPICYSVLHLTTAALPKMQCRTCKSLFHSDCLCKWFTKSNSSACPLCRSAF